jgi:DNA-binding transcriptional LysR family regulator
LTGRRPLRATELGTQLARLGARIHALNAKASRLVQSYRKGHAGRLRIAGTPIFMDGVVSTLIADFQSRHPDVQIVQSYGYFDQLAASLRTGSLDMAIVPLHQGSVPADMRFVPLLAGRNVIAARAGHPLTRRNTITLADIDPYPWIAPPADSPLYRDLQRALKSIGKEDFRVSFSGGTLASIISILGGSDSLTVLPYSVVFLTRKSSGLAALRLKIEHPDRQLGLLTFSAATHSPAQRQFASFLRDEFALLEARIQHEGQVTQRRG